MKRLLIVLTLFLSLQSYSQITLIPDANFEQGLITLGFDTGTPNGSVPTVNISSITSLYIWQMNITDLTGIQDFSALTFLNCHDNQLTSLDLSQNTALTNLACYRNQLTSLNVSQNNALVYLDCNTNQLPSLDVSHNNALTTLYCLENQLPVLDVSHNTALTKLYCGFNLMSSLDVSHNTALNELYCYYSQLTSLDVSHNTALNQLWCYNNQFECLNVKNGNNSTLTIHAAFNPNLTCITVDDVAWATANWIVVNNIDAQTSFSTNCGDAACALGIDDLSIKKTKLLSKIIDLTGREIPFKKNTMMIYIYEDGSSDRVIELD